MNSATLFTVSPTKTDSARHQQTDAALHISSKQQDRAHRAREHRDHIERDFHIRHRSILSQLERVGKGLNLAVGDTVQDADQGHRPFVVRVRQLTDGALEFR